MKKFIVALFLIIFCTESTLFSMDPAPTTNTGLSEGEMITKINQAIDKKYRSDNIFIDLFYTPNTLTLENCLDIIQIAQTHYPHITDSAIKNLYDSNCFFKKSIDYFIEQASQNLKKITANNIKTIENPKNHQPTDDLNKLQLPIKTYVMNKAVKHAQCFYNFGYDIVLKGEHLNPITAFDICECTDQAVTSSFDEKGFLAGKYNSQLIEWNLKTGKPSHTFNETDPVYIVTFSPNGSQIAGAMYTEKAIKIWCTKTKQLLHKLLSSSHGTTSLSCLSFSHPTGSLLTALYSGTYIQDLYINQWSLTDNKTGELINSYKVYTGRGEKSRFEIDKYCAEHPYTYLATPKTELHITKKSCAPLYLCMQAIHKSGDRSHISTLIESSASFCSLTDLEIKKVHFEMNRK